MNFESAAEFCLNYALKKGVVFVDVRAEHSTSNHFLIHNGVLKSVSFGSDEGVGVRIKTRRNNALIFFSTNNLERNNLKSLIDNAIKLSEKRKISVEDGLCDNNKTFKKKYSVKQKINVLDLGPDEKIKLLLDLEKKTRDFAESRFFSLSDELTRKLILTSDGTRILSVIPRIHFYYVINVFEKNKVLEHYLPFGSSSGYEIIKRWNLSEKIKNDALALRNNLKHGRRLKPGVYDVVVAPEVTGIIVHESCGHPFEADRILGREAAQAGESFIKPEMLNKLFASVNVNIVDDPTVPKSYGYYLFDDEGVKARRKFLIRTGRITDFLHNKTTALLFNTKSNGSARSTSYEFEPIVRMSNTFMLPGDYYEEELIEGVKKGVFIKSFMEWNIDDKRFNQKYVGSEAYLIINGEVKEPIINPVLEITTPQLYKSIDVTANNLELFAGTCGKGEPMQGIPVTMGGPSFRMRRIRLR